jgi:porin
LKTNSGFIVKFCAPVILLAPGLLVPALAQTNPGPADANPPDATQPSVPSSSSGGWYDPAESKRFSALDVKSSGGLSPDFGDGLLGNAGGVRSDLADVGIAGTIYITGTWWQNVLNAPRRSNGGQAYVGQRDTHFQLYGIYGTYDLGHIGLEGAQLMLDGGCSASSDISVWAKGCRVIELSFFDSFFHGKVDLSAGFLANDLAFVDTYVGGNAQTGGFGPAGILPVEAGLGQQPGTAPGLNITYHFDENWYDKIGVQRSLSPLGIVEDFSVINKSGFRFNEPSAHTLVIDQFGFKRPSSQSALSSDFRVGGLYNWSEYANFDTGSTSHNRDVFLLGDQQLRQPDSRLPFRGWYAGFTYMDNPADVNVFQRYYEARFYNDGPFASHPFDQFSIIISTTTFSQDARLAEIRAGAFAPPKTTTSETISYAYKVAHGTYIHPGFTYTNNPSFVTQPGIGHDLNFFFNFQVTL